MHAFHVAGEGEFPGDAEWDVFWFHVNAFMVIDGCRRETLLMGVFLLAVFLFLWLEKPAEQTKVLYAYPCVVLADRVVL